MNIQEVVYGRRSVREYTAKDVDQETIRQLIDAGTHAPSAINQQPWAFTVVRDQALLDRVSREAKAILLSEQHPEHVHSLLSEEGFHIFYRAPVLVLISATEQGAWIVEDCALAAANMMLCAYAAGLGSCWIGFAKRYLNTPAGKAALDLPNSYVPVAPIILGHPKGSAPGVARNKPLVTWIG